jgi:UDP-N-acetylmuramoyl-tripeptide--D-alanyl-D-alanine ligase
VLSARFRVLKSEGNFNNHFGLPLMLLKLEPEYDVAVIEMGMSHAGEIRALAKIAQPEIGVVTNVAPVHLEFFDSVAGIARAKYELIESLPAGGVAVLNADDEYVSQFGRDFKGKVVMYGTRATADVRAENIQSKGPEGVEFDLVIGSVAGACQVAAGGRAQCAERAGSGGGGCGAGAEAFRGGGGASDTGSGGQTRAGSPSG